MRLCRIDTSLELSANQNEHNCHRLSIRSVFKDENVTHSSSSLFSITNHTALDYSNSPSPFHFSNETHIPNKYSSSTNHQALSKWYQHAHQPAAAAPTKPASAPLKRPARAESRALWNAHVRRPPRRTRSRERGAAVVSLHSFTTRS